MARRAASESMRAEVFQNLVQPGGVEGFSVCGGVFREEQAGGLGNGGAGVGKIGAGVYADSSAAMTMSFVMPSTPVYPAETELREQQMTRVSGLAARISVTSFV